ncbi:hypothetical protein RI129_006765 [Pyrocoelia pectoralis]|uniref:UBX domain-containing protein 1 n=1 Tax=Pyrocoelia pectoralis TaxID=417401 RepID=A0AAN7VBW0_9COLE
MSEIINTLTEMGFSRSRAELAISTTKAQNVEQAMEWLLSNEELESPIPESTVTEPTPINSVPENIEEKANIEPQEKEVVAKSIKCDDCGKLFTSSVEVEFHGTKSGHTNFSESTEEKKPLTEEEKKEQLGKIEAKLKQRRLEREAREKAEELERERGRIRSGKDLLEAKRKHEEAEIKKMLDQKNREKQEEKLARERVRQQIEQDKIARKALFEQKMEQPKVEQVSVAPVKSAITNYSEVKLCIRLTNGNTLTQTFGAKEPLSAVRVFIEMNRTDESGPFQLRLLYPIKVFTSEDYDKPLEMLDLAPTAVLVVSKT